MDPKQHVSASLEVLMPVVDGVRTDQLDAPTPCVKWTVADLLGHLVGGGYIFAGALRGDPPPSEAPAAPAPAQLQGALHGAVDDFNDAVGRLTDLEAPVPMPFGTMPAGAVLHLAACDLLIHAWDLARATGQPLAPPVALLDETDTVIRGMIAPELRDGDFFADEVTPPAGAGPLERIVAFSGRQP
jgi:uncharacterized protein (TIGR03086 family)